MDLPKVVYIVYMYEDTQQGYPAKHVLGIFYTSKEAEERRMFLTKHHSWSDRSYIVQPFKIGGN
jgi:hypothetical protein